MPSSVPLLSLCEEHCALAEPGALQVPAEEIPEVLSCDALMRLIAEIGSSRSHAGL